MRNESVIKLLSLFGIILTLSLFFLGSRLNKVVTIVVDRLFLVSLFTADHNLIMELKEQRLNPSINLLWTSYQGYFLLLYSRNPSQQELLKIQTIQDYLNEVGINHDEISSRVNKITEGFLAEKKNIEILELILIAILISSQIINTLLINSRKQTNQNRSL